MKKLAVIILTVLALVITASVGSCAEQDAAAKLMEELKTHG